MKRFGRGRGGIIEKDGEEILPQLCLPKTNIMRERGGGRGGEREEGEEYGLRGRTGRHISVLTSEMMLRELP